MSNGNDGKFFKNINESEAGQFLALAANFTGISSVAVQVIFGIISLLSLSDTDKILRAIDRLGAQISLSFQQLGDLIKQQTRIVVETVNRDAMAVALSHTDAALFFLRTFLRTKNVDDLRIAVQESILGIGFFLDLNQIPPDVFFLPGLIKAGTARISVIAVADPNFLNTRPDDVGQIKGMIAMLSNIIDQIIRKVDTAHFVELKGEDTTPPPPPPPEPPPPTFIRIAGVSHDEFTGLPGPNQFVQLDFFPVGGNLDFNNPASQNDPEVISAFQQAQSACIAGVKAELAFIGIPGFQTILQNWKQTLVNPNVQPGGGVQTA